MLLVDVELIVKLRNVGVEFRNFRILESLLFCHEWKYDLGVEKNETFSKPSQW